MKIKLTKRKGTVTLKVSAGSKNECVDLKDILLGAIRKRLTVGNMMAEFKDRGYSSTLTKDAPSTKVFELKRRA